MELIDGDSDELLRSKFAFKNPEPEEIHYHSFWMNELEKRRGGSIMFYAHLYDPEREFVDDSRLAEWIQLLYREQQLPKTTSRFEENLQEFATRMSRMRIFTNKRPPRADLFQKWAKEDPDTKFRVLHSHEGGFWSGVLLFLGESVWSFVSGPSICYITIPGGNQLMTGASRKMEEELDKVLVRYAGGEEEEEDDDKDDESIQPPKKIQEVAEETFAVSSFGVPDISYWLNSSFETLVGEGGQKKKSARSAIEPNTPSSQ